MVGVTAGASFLASTGWAETVAVSLLGLFSGFVSGFGTDCVSLATGCGMTEATGSVLVSAVGALGVGSLFTVSGIFVVGVATVASFFKSIGKGGVD